MIYFFYCLIKKCANVFCKCESEIKKRADIFLEASARFDYPIA